MADSLKIRVNTSQNFTGNGTNKAFTLSNNPHSILKITVNNVVNTAYNLSGNVVTFTTAPANNAVIVIQYSYWTGVPAIAGTDGKSAYQSAVSGGYTGSESAFNSALASIANKQDIINVNGILKGNGAGVINAAVAGTDYVLPTGNVASATKLASSRTFLTDLAIKTAGNFDGTGNVTLGVTGILPIANGGTGNTTGLATSATKLAASRTFQANLATSTVGSFDGTGNVTLGVTGTLPIANGGTGNTTGLAASATKLATARNLQTNLASTTAGSFDGTGNVTLGVTGTLPISNGGTGATSASAALTALGAAPSSHNQSASTITAGTLGGAVVANATGVTNLGSKQVRNIYAGTSDMTAGSSALTTGDIYIYYEG